MRQNTTILFGEMVTMALHQQWGGSVSLKLFSFFAPSRESTGTAMSELTAPATCPGILYTGKDGKMTCISSAAKVLRTRKTGK
jgi:hypothetical protein